MNKLIRLAVWVIGLTAPVAASATPVIWSFHETSCVTEQGANCTPPQPFVFITLTLPGATSAGSAFWQGSGSPPVYSGDSFALSVPFFGFKGAPLTPAFAGNDDCTVASPSLICDFNIQWSETAGHLDSASISIDGVFDNIGGLTFHGLLPLGLNGGQVGTDSPFLGGCDMGTTPCTIGGFWQSDLAVPEPMSAVLLITGLLGTCFASRSRLSGRIAAGRPSAGTRGVWFIWCEGET
jgi:hypothetical protein